MATNRIGALAGVTMVVPHLGAAIDAWATGLDYRGDPPVPVGPALAARWGCPSAAGAPSVMLYPASGERRFVRLVEGRSPGFTPSTTHGWTAAEIVVQDLDALADRLAGGPFEIVGPPAVLDFDFTDQIRAMQVVGPGGAMLYLTEIGDEIPGFDLPSALSFVGQLFIMVLGGSSIAAAAAPYAARGALPGPILQARVAVLAQAHHRSPEDRYDLATIALPDRSLIEVDAFPTDMPPRTASSIALPAGIAMASFCADHDEVVVGACGELIELIGNNEKV